VGPDTTFRNLTMLKRIFAICGSTRQDSVNHHLINEIITRYSSQFQIELYTGIAGIIAFNPDISGSDQPEAVQAFRNAIRGADGVLICSPEYAHGVPGALKNALDWTVGSADFSGKPTALITASTDGTYSHASLLEILRTIDTKNVNEHHLLIQFIKTKMDAENKLSHQPTITAINMLMEAFGSTINNI
jgi:chromate reductase, NAD(P)H dehydrogenase (quinone)